MRKITSLIFVLVVCFCSNVYADTFISVGVFSDVREYDQNDFPGQGGIARMMVYADATGNGVTVDSDVTGDGVPLGWDSGNKLWVRTFDSPPIGADWQTTYLFHNGSNTRNLDISGCTIRKLPIPNVTISADGRTISWNPVDHATYYSIYWYPLKDGLPDESGGPLRRIDRIDDTFITLGLTFITPGRYALRLNAHEICSTAIVNGSTFAIINRSTLYKKHVTPINVPDIRKGFLGGLAHYYTFTLSSQTDVTISLFSTDFNAYLILRNYDTGDKWEDENGHVDCGDEETDDEFGTNSELSLELSKGVYTVGVTSKSESLMGLYCLVIRDIANASIENICRWRDRQYPAVYPTKSWDCKDNPNAWTADMKLVDGSNMVGRCGKGNFEGMIDCWNTFRYTRDCFNHDVCVGQYGHLHCVRLLGNCWDDCKYAPNCDEAYYVDSYLGSCGGKAPCFSTIQDAIDTAVAIVSERTIKILQGSYDEVFNLSSPINLILEGGWNATYTSQSPNTTFIKAPKATQGSLRLRMVTIRP